MTVTASPNFGYLSHHDPRLAALATQAEEHFAADPTITLWKLRQFAEVLAQRAAAKVGLYIDPLEGQQRLIDRLADGGAIGATQRSLFHDLRRVGNAAVHEGSADKGGGRKRLSDAQIKKVLIDESIAAYEGNCPCPYSRARNGSRCGKRSAYSREGGAAPLCFPEAVSVEMVQAYRDEHPED